MADEDFELAVGVVANFIVPLHESDGRNEDEGRGLGWMVGHDEGDGLDGLAHTHLIYKISVKAHGNIEEMKI